MAASSSARWRAATWPTSDMAQEGAGLAPASGSGFVFMLALVNLFSPSRLAKTKTTNRPLGGEDDDLSMMEPSERFPRRQPLVRRLLLLLASLSPAP